ncbi:hypothetical protein LINPERHAP1_LOCUS29912 [Linum perenne]
MQNHSHCAKLNRVPFPLYDELAFVYGKGRATGKTAVDLEELNEACPRIDDLSCSIGSTRKMSMMKLKVVTKKTNPTTKQALLPWLKNVPPHSLIRRRHSLKHLANPKGCVALKLLVVARWPN